jgi:hypothetical protein
VADAVFLWGDSRERPNPSNFVQRSTAWWLQYSAHLKLSSASAAELFSKSREVVSLLPDPLHWVGPRPFRGLIVGAVQSGKTSSMIGVSAIALDQGYRLIVVLAGGKDDLRQQTARRFNTQLLVQRDEIPQLAGAYTLSISSRDRPLGGVALPYSVDVHNWALGYVRVRQALRDGQPCIFVIKKHEASLAEMRKLLGRAYEDFGIEKLPTVIFDDECDEASVESERMPIPEAIANLWRFASQPPVAYLGYTATAAANLLQAPDNELYPEHMVSLLRYPDAADSPLTYREKDPESWYSGGECFYEAFGTSPGPLENFLVEASVLPEHLENPIEDNLSLREALRAFVVSGAYRLALQPGAKFDDIAHLPAPHSMLVQTSASMDEHDRWKQGILKMFGGTADASGIDVKGVERDLHNDEKSWERWYTQFFDSSERLYRERPPLRATPHVSWAQVRALIPSVVENIRLKAINSDPIFGQDLDYQPRLMRDGSVAPPQDIYVIAIGGARLSRGITLEGLCISYFTRWTPNPTEDTVLQISRWFGYRGRHLAFCRLFTTLDIYENLQEMNENDKDLRLQLHQLMKDRKTPREAGLILKSNPRSLPTAKLGAGALFDLAFSPFQTVFRDVETAGLSSANETAALNFIGEVMRRRPEVVKNDTGGPRGYLSRDWNSVEIASILDVLQYSKHNPALEGNPAGQFHKRPDEMRPRRSAFRYLSDPYQVAAYLRQWDSYARTANVPPPPKFNVGFAYGEQADGREPFGFALLNREITDADKLIGQWTGRSALWKGDALFDNPDQRLVRAGSSIREVGLSGLLLLYVIHKDAQGRGGRGKRRGSHTVTFGISIPAGGPAFRRVTIKPS